MSRMKNEAKAPERSAVDGPRTRESEGLSRAAAREVMNDGFLDDLMGRVDDGGLALTGKDGFVPELVKAVLERGLQAELADHLGYEKHGRGCGEFT